MKIHTLLWFDIQQKDSCFLVQIYNQIYFANDKTKRILSKKMCLLELLAKPMVHRRHILIVPILLQLPYDL